MTQELLTSWNARKKRATNKIKTTNSKQQTTKNKQQTTTVVPSGIKYTFADSVVRT